MCDASRRAGTTRRTRRRRGRSGDRRSQQRCRRRRPVRCAPAARRVARPACRMRRAASMRTVPRRRARRRRRRCRCSGITAAADVAVGAVRERADGSARAGDGFGGFGYSAVRGRCCMHLGMRLVGMRCSGVHHVSVSVRQGASGGTSRPAQHAAGEDEHQSDTQREHRRDYRRGRVGPRGVIMRRCPRRLALELELRLWPETARQDEPDGRNRLVPSIQR